VSQGQLENVLFPLGALTKPEVRKIAVDLNLATATRKDSQGICFVGKVDLPVFLQQQLAARIGRIIIILPDSSFTMWRDGLPVEDTPASTLASMAAPHTMDQGKGLTIGKHNGAHFYTVGQRKGLNIGGYKEPLFVLSTDTESNIVYVGEGQLHGGLHRKGLFIKAADVHWIRPDLAMHQGEVRDYLVRIRYRQPLQRARLFAREDGYYVIFDKQQRGITPGQFAAWYDGDELLGSGAIHE